MKTYVKQLQLTFRSVNGEKAVLTIAKTFGLLTPFCKISDKYNFELENA